MRIFKSIYTLSMVVVLILGLSSALTFAESNRIKSARAWVQRGEEALKEGHLREALLAFESAERYQSSINHQMMIAKVYEAMPKADGCLRAIGAWQSILDSLQAQKSSLVPKAKSKVDQLKAKCTRKVSIISQPSGAKIWVDDELVGFSPLLIEVKASAKQLRGEWQGNAKQRELSSGKSEFKFEFKKQVKNIIGAKTAAYHKISDMPKNKESSVIQFQAKLHCRALVEDSYQDLSSCQSRALWEGDQFKLSFESDQAVYLYVFLSNSTGQRQTLFPRGKSQNLLPANTKSELPMGQWFTLDEVGPVTETIHVIYARNPVSAFEALRSLDKPAKKSMKIKTLAMSSVRGVVLPSSNQGLRMSVSNNLDDQSHFLGRDEINRVEFELLHQGARPKID